MLRIFSWVRGKREVVAARPLPFLLQGILHLTVIYVVARRLVPWALDFNNPRYFASHMLLFGLIVGIATGFVTGRLWRHPIVRLVWVCPVLLLALAIVFSGPDVYPTMPFQSNWAEAFRFYFVPVSGLPSQMFTQDGLRNVSMLSLMAHSDAQFRAVVPGVVGVAYSIGALLSGLLKIPIPELCFKKEGSELDGNSC
jgi:hypothetical protein